MKLKDKEIELLRERQLRFQLVQRGLSAAFSPRLSASVDQHCHPVAKRENCSAWAAGRQSGLVASSPSVDGAVCLERGLCLILQQCRLFFVLCRAFCLGHVEQSPGIRAIFSRHISFGCFLDVGFAALPSVVQSMRPFSVGSQGLAVSIWKTDSSLITVLQMFFSWVISFNH